MEPYILLAIDVSAAFIFGCLIGYFIYWIKNRKAIKAKKMLKDPDKIMKALQKHGRIIDKGEEIKVSVRNEDGRKRLVIDREKIPVPIKPEIKKKTIKEPLKEKRSDFFKVLKGGDDDKGRR